MKKLFFISFIVFLMLLNFSLLYSQEKTEKIEYKKIVFYVFEDSKGLYQIGKMDENGKNKEILTKKGNNWCPSISTDGEKIAFFSDRSGFINLWIMDVNGNNKIQLTEDNENIGVIDLYNRGQIEWDKDSNTIFFLKNNDIWQIDKEGNAPSAMTDSHNITMFKLSPDKEIILFAKEKTKKHNGLFVMQINGKNLRKLVKSEISYPSFSWGKNNKIFFFYNSGIFSIDFIGTNLKRLIQTYYSEPYISYNTKGSDYIAFITDKENGPNLWIMDSNGKNITQLTKNTAFSPIWSLDGNFIYFVQKHDIYKINIKTKDKKRLTYYFNSYYPVPAEIKISSGENNE